MPPLLDVLSAWPEPLSSPVSGPGELTQYAARHGLAGFVLHALPRSALEPSHQAALRRAALGSAAQGMRVKALLLQSLDALAARGIVPGLLKGYGLGSRLYPEALERATSDVDLLVEEAQFSEAAAALEALGLRRLPAADPSEAHHLELSGPAGLVELHFRALSGSGLAIEAAPLLFRSSEAVLEGRQVRYLAPEDELFYLAVHASNHLLQRVAWLFDLKLLLLAHPRLSWERVLRASSETGLGTLVWYALDASARLVAAPVPPEVLRSLAPPWWQQRVARLLFRPDALLACALSARKPAWIAAKLLLAPRLRPMARYTLHRLSHGARGLLAKRTAGP